MNKYLCCLRECSLIIVFLLYGCKNGNSNLYILLDDAEGLQTGSVIQSSGVVIGEVKDLGLIGTKAIIRVSINGKYKVPQGAKFKVVLDNILQRKSFIDVTFSDSSRFYANGDTVTVQNAKQVEKRETPVVLDSSSKAEMLKVFKQIDTLLNPPKEQK